MNSPCYLSIEELFKSEFPFNLFKLVVLAIGLDLLSFELIKIADAPLYVFVVL